MQGLRGYIAKYAKSIADQAEALARSRATESTPAQLWRVAVREGEGDGLIERQGRALAHEPLALIGRSALQ